jgi:hypothetical protein
MLAELTPRPEDNGTLQGDLVDLVVAEADLPGPKSDVADKVCTHDALLEHGQEVQVDPTRQCV